MEYLYHYVYDWDFSYRLMAAAVLLDVENVKVGVYFAFPVLVFQRLFYDFTLTQTSYQRLRLQIAVKILLLS